MRKSIYAITAVLLLLAAVGCDTTTGSGTEPGTGPGQDGLAVVSLSIAGTTAGRTVLPAQAKLEEAAKWRLLGGKTGETRKPLTELFSYPTNQTLHLATGDWDFTLEGYADEFGETLILGETIRGRRITLEGPNTLSFVVEPVVDGTGSIEIAIELPAGHGITRVEVFKDGEPLELEPPLLPDAQNNIVFEQEDHKAGDYYYSFRLFKGDELYGVVSELVQVRMNLSSTAAYELKQEDLNLSYVIAYHLNVNEPDPDYYRRTDAALVLAKPDDRKGYEFDGWYDNDGLGGAPLAKLPTPVTGGNRDFYAQWEIINYDIDYVLGDEGSDNGGNLTTYTVESSEIILKKPNTNGKFLFLYWHVEGYPEKAVATIPAGSTGHKTFYAKWIPQHPIAFHPNGGNPPPETQYVAEGDKADEPIAPAKALDLVVDGIPETAGLYTGLTFAGWHLDDPDGEEWNFDEDTVAGPLELYAKWTAVPVDISQQTGNTMLNKALNYINGLTLDDETPFTIVLDGSWSMGVYDDQRMASINKANAVITLVGKGPDPTVIEGCISATSFTIGNGTLILDRNITIKGAWECRYALVRVNSTGALIMQEGATITEGKVGGTSYGTGGVEVNGGSFLMNGGEISKNRGNGSSSSGGVSVSNSGSFTMKNGTISGNTANYGGGVSLRPSASFSKTGPSVIYGDEDNNPDNGKETDNTA
jgi:uncharacterized repeat protein (TIGR02543 family)